MIRIKYKRYLIERSRYILWPVFSITYRNINKESWRKSYLLIIIKSSIAITTRKEAGTCNYGSGRVYIGNSFIGDVGTFCLSYETTRRIWEVRLAKGKKDSVELFERYVHCFSMGKVMPSKISVFSSYYRNSLVSKKPCLFIRYNDW